MNTNPLGLILIAVGVLAGLLWLFYGSQGAETPADAAYLDGNAQFRQQDYSQAAASYQNALAEDPDHAPALRGLANSYVQLRRYDEGLAIIERAVELEPQNGGNYAIRGIILDHTGAHERAIADYEKSLELDPSVADGMPWLDRLLYNVQERPPTVADRLKYLKQQMALPEDQRVLRVPDADDQQRPYEQ